jgi:hypothetical protein
MTGLCFRLKQTIAYIKNPPSKSASQYNAILTADKSPWKMPTNEKSKYDSYVRVLRRRRGLLCCN